MPDWMSKERLNLIESLGAKIHPVSKEEGGFLSCIERAEELSARTERAFLPRQFSNQDNIEAHYRTTGPEIWEQTEGGIDVLVSGVGTGGTIRGVSRYIKGEKKK